ncbi:hypothetical protein SGRIM128S_05983 [Streptomyces griseomycini]
MSEGQSSHRISFISPASVSVRPQTRQRAGLRCLRHPPGAVEADTAPEEPRSTPPAPPTPPRPAAAVLEPGRSPSRKRLGRRFGRPPGERESAQERWRRSRARVTPT